MLWSDTACSFTLLSVFDRVPWIMISRKTKDRCRKAKDGCSVKKHGSGKVSGLLCRERM